MLRDTRAVEFVFSELIRWILAGIVLVTVLVLIYILYGGGENVIAYIKELSSFG